MYSIMEIRLLLGTIFSFSIHLEHLFYQFLLADLVMIGLDFVISYHNLLKQLKHPQRRKARRTAGGLKTSLLFFFFFCLEMSEKEKKSYSNTIFIV